MGFYEDLATVIHEEVDNRKPSLYSQLRLNADIWYKTLNKLTIEVCTDKDFWLNFWLEHPVRKPTEEDRLFLQNRDKAFLEWLEDKHMNREYLKEHRNNMLNDIQLVLSVSLKYLILNHCGKTETAKNLNQYWILGNAELKKRGFETLDFNPYDVDMKAIAEGKIIELTKEKSQIYGICPNCKTRKHVISNGNMWLCKKCKRNFRKKSITVSYELP